MSLATLAPNYVIGYAYAKCVLRNLLSKSIAVENKWPVAGRADGIVARRGD